MKFKYQVVIPGFGRRGIETLCFPISILSLCILPKYPITISLISFISFFTIGQIGLHFSLKKDIENNKKILNINN